MMIQLSKNCHYIMFLMNHTKRQLDKPICDFSSMESKDIILETIIVNTNSGKGM